jgi:pimeloyl-ACP methyl ester carboxylesterase
MSWLAAPGEPGFRPFVAGRFAELPEQPRLLHAYAEAEGHDVQLASSAFGRCTLHVKTMGQGPPLLLVHGLMTSSYSWRYVLEPLAERFTVYAPDLPGAGRSDAPLGGDWSAAGTATVIRELQRELGIAGCACVGNSMGGYLTLWAMEQDPAAFSRLLVLHAPGVPELRLWALRAVLSIPGAYGILDWLVRRDPVRWCFDNVHYWDESLKSLQEARAYAEPLTRPDGRAAFARMLHRTLNPAGMAELGRRLAARTERFDERVRLLYVPRDPMVSPRVGPKLHARLPGATLAWLDEGSHFAHVDRPELFLADAVPFLQGA